MTPKNERVPRVRAGQHYRVVLRDVAAVYVGSSRADSLADDQLAALRDSGWSLVHEGTKPPLIADDLVATREALRKSEIYRLGLADATARANKAEAQRDQAWRNLDTAHDDIAALLRESGLGDHARPVSTHDVIRDELLPWVIRAAKAVHGDGLREALKRIVALQPKGPFRYVSDELAEAQEIARTALWGDEPRLSQPLQPCDCDPIPHDRREHIRSGETTHD